MGVGLGPEDNKLEGGFQNGTCQYQCPCGRISSPKWLLLVFVSQCDPQLPSDSLWDSPDHQVGLIQVPLKLLLLPWVSVWNFSVHPFKCGVFISPNPFVGGACSFLSSVLLQQILEEMDGPVWQLRVTLWISPKKAFQRQCSENVSSRHRAFGLGSPMWSLDPSLSLRRTSAILVNHLLWVAHPRGMGLHYTTPLFLLPTFGFFFIFLVIGGIFQSSSSVVSQ